MTSVRGSVLMQVAGLELLARNSLNAMRHSSLLSSIEEFREEERGSVTDKEWNWKILRNQFLQKNLEDLYRKYDDKLMLGYQSLFLILLTVMSLTHILIVVFVTGVTCTDDIIAVVCYSLRIIIAAPIVGTAFSVRLTTRYKWLNNVSSIAILSVLVITDACVPVLSTAGPALRPSYATVTLLACYVFMPVKNNYVAGSIAIVISICQLAVLWTVTYLNEPSKYRKLGADLLFLLGINFLGVYYRLMNEVVKRRSFLDKRGCVEATLKLNYEKEQEERLMSSILPEHIISIVRNDISEIFRKIQTETYPSPIKVFSHLYIEEHKNVSILYADVVNYTMITTTLPARVLVETLNELFGRFDEASEEHDVLRIKFLGDCYYCVSGVPKQNRLHAKSCVDLGLDMISIIAEVRERRRLNIDMRIGVHSGDIMSGLIGIRKWQYDIWSKDVTIANKMESTGKAGKVHITQRTLEELSDDARDYIIEPYFEARNDPLLSKYKIETFLVTKQLRNNFRRISVGMDKWLKKGQVKAKVPDNLNPMPRRRTTGFMDNNLVAYRRMLKDADVQMAEVIDKMPSGIISEYMGEETINPYTLLYRNATWERSFIAQPDPLFKYFIGAGLFVLILMMGIQGLTIEALGWKTLVIDASLAILLLILQPLTWTVFLWRKWNYRKEPKNRFIKFFYDRSAAIVWSATSRSILYLIVSTMLSVSSLINLTECDFKFTGDPLNPIIFDEDCIAPWHLAQTCTLALMMSFLFSRVFFLLKWTMGLTLTGIYVWLVWDIKSEIFEQGPSWNRDMDARISHTLALIFLTLTLHCTDRQTEYRNRLDHRWKRQLTQEQDAAYTMKLVNNMLLNNILPAHVADIYLNTNRNPEDLYHEEYSTVSVMFASLTDYKLGIDDDSDVSERTMLKILDQLISDFDQLLLSDNSNQLKVEKIKMAGWTYMAACGLEPGRRATHTSVNSMSTGPVRSNQVYEDDVIITMLQFAAQMMKQLRAFNRSSFQSFQGTNLKIGISHGEVTAGVVGSLKPLYDIWGNAVNMASRMDSTGEAGKIQVTENTAIALDRQGILTQYRGKIFVKGAGYVRTYFVPLDNDFNVLYKSTDSQVSLQSENNIETTRL